MTTVKPRVPFFIKQEVCIEATCSMRLFLPPGLLGPEETIGDIITLSSDNIEIGMKESSNNPGKISAIMVFLKSGDKITLHRSAEALVDNDDGNDVELFIHE